MADPKAENNVQHFLAKIAGVEETTPAPQTNVEHYLAKIAGEDVTVPEEPSTTEEYYLDKIAEKELVEIETLSVTENGTYTAEEGTAYNPVTVEIAGVTLAGPYGPYKVGDTIQTLAYQSLLNATNPSASSVCIATDGNHFAALVSYDGTTFTFKRTNTSENVEFTISKSGTTITAITGANELTWWRTLETVSIETVSGIIATFETNLVAKLKECKANIEPVQAGSGDPSPDNVRPISGWTGANIHVSPTTEAADGTTYPITFPSEAGTVYGGTLDVTNGTLTVDRVKITHSFNLPTQQDLGRWVMGFYLENVLTELFGKMWEVSIPPLKNLFRVSNLPIIVERELTDTDYATVSFYGHTTGVEIRPRFMVSQFSAEEAQAIASAMEFTYPINPIVYDLTPTEVTTLLGQNNIWADTGNIEVKYYAI